MENLLQNILAISLGMMIFFSFVLAPMIFKILDAENAGKFVRKIFPYYYFVNLIFLTIATVIFFFTSSLGVDFYITLALALSFIFAQFLLMPLINKLKDNNQEKKFKYAHGLSVLINFVQMIGLIYLLI
tara:strand:+ start:148 stop:534 length:387 start_codon:yes stop_codon:yes gene_type:complete